MLVGLRLDGLDDLVKLASEERLLRRPLRKGLRGIGKTIKATVVRLARPVSKKMARRVTVIVNKAPTPAWVRVRARHPAVHVFEVGRSPGAKAPPAGKLKGGFAAARAVSKRGRPGFHVMERADRASVASVQQMVGELSRDIEAIWKGRGGA